MYIYVIIHDICSTWAKSFLWPPIWKPPKKQTNIKLNPNTILYMLSFTFVTRYIYSTIKDLDFEDAAVCISMVTEVMTGWLQTETFLKYKNKNCIQVLVFNKHFDIKNVPFYTV